MDALRFLVVEPQPAEARRLNILLGEAFAVTDIRRVTSADAAVDALEACGADVVVCGDGLGPLSWHAPGTALLAVVDSAAAAVSALCDGAHAILVRQEADVPRMVHAVAKARREQRIQAAQERALLMVNRSRDGFWVCRPDGVLSEVNDAYCRMLGHKRGDLLGTALHDLEARPDPARTKAHLHTIMTDGSDRFETRYRRHDGTVLDVEVSAYYRHDAGEIIGLLRDISQRTSLLSALAESERRFRDISEAAGEYLWEVDARGRCTYVSGRVKQVQGYTPAEVLGRTPFVFMDRAEAKRVRTWFTRSADGAEPFRDLEYRSRHKAGHDVWLRVSGMPILDDRGTVTGYRGAAMDVTQRKLMEENLRRMATTDPLTGAANRRHFMAVLDDELTRARRYGNPLAVAMLDIDHFKRLNDTYGHAAGDMALVQYVAEIQGRLRTTDMLGRLGGEEFALILPETTAEGARAAVDALRAAREAVVLEHEGRELRFTMSAGVADTSHAGSGADLLAAADAALYVSKHTGRNRVTIADTESVPAE